MSIQNQIRDPFKTVTLPKIWNHKPQIPKNSPKFWSPNPSNPSIHYQNRFGQPNLPTAPIQTQIQTLFTNWTWFPHHYPSNPALIFPNVTPRRRQVCLHQWSTSPPVDRTSSYASSPLALLVSGQNNSNIIAFISPSPHSCTTIVISGFTLHLSIVEAYEQKRAFSPPVLRPCEPTRLWHRERWDSINHPLFSCIIFHLPPSLSCWRLNNI